MSQKYLVPLVLPADPTAALEAATKQYVDARAVAGAPPSWRNLFDNGCGLIAQRPASASLAGGTYFGVDRWMAETSTGSFATGWMLLSTFGGAACPYQHGTGWYMNCNTGATPTAAQYAAMKQQIEGRDIVASGLAKGTASAQPLTLSFWFYSTQAGTFICEVEDVINLRSISRSITHAGAGWQFFSLTYTADTTGVMSWTNSPGIQVRLWLSAGSQYNNGVLANLNQVWTATATAGTNRAAGQTQGSVSGKSYAWTAVQLEVGSNATPYERRSLTDEQARAYRYLYRAQTSTVGFQTFGQGQTNSATQAKIALWLPQPMRALPASSTGGTFRLHTPGAGPAVTSMTVISNESDVNNRLIMLDCAGTGFAGTAPALLQGNDTTAFIQLQAEI